jgi:hypothetical protein
MRICLGCATRHREFSRMFQRVYNALQPMTHAFESLNIDHPDYVAVLLGVTDDERSDYFEVVPNTDHFFQVVVGCPPDITEQRLGEHLIKTLLRVVRECPLSAADRQRCEVLFSNYTAGGTGPL